MWTMWAFQQRDRKYKKNQIETLELKSSITTEKFTRGVQYRLNQTEGRIKRLKDKSLETIQSKEQKQQQKN